ncbi:PDZ domain-containing protein [Nocardioides aromaticivorans]|uniref:PDZ domain-containing protein n=1 Tax=Nocardioides aromaticivorans TaxID=200618 RepID=A0A7Z0CQ40_9ACTN|nr:S16 family serine protease [Nocardioides aromaticivorans]NYI46575.1 PDZ domain-containing protein [Nocardioides aromaticivorans]QSR25740.1 signaling protein [Nocardioides aromaticivorans]
MSQRLIAVCIAGPLALILGGIALAVPLPYASYSPGPTFDILGTDENQAEVIQVDGHKAYYDKGQIRFTTVIASSYGQKLTLGDALTRWFDPDRAVVPYDVVHPPEQSKKDEEAEGQVQMSTSQDTAKAVALKEIGVDVPTAVQAAAVAADGPAADKLLPGDLFREVDGEPVTDADQIVKAVQKHKDLSNVEFKILRDKDELTVRVKPKLDDEGVPKVGVQVGLGYEFPFKIQLRVDPTVGGPSAGLMFSLAIYDTLTPGSMTGGATVAGTGELLPDGTVGPIGGIAQKIAGAQEAGAQLFFVPKDNCPDVTDLDPDLRLVKATTMHEARLALEKWSKDHDAELPAC